MATFREQAIVYIKAGNTEKGKQLLIEVLRQDPRDETAWLWMTQVVNTDDERIKCLRYALNINPQNENARRGLAQLQAKQVPRKPAPLPAQQMGAKPEPTQRSETKRPQSPPQPKRQKTNPLVVGVGLGVLGSICLCGGLLLFKSLIPTAPSVLAGTTYSTPTTGPTGTAYSTSTTGPTETAYPTSTISATETLALVPIATAAKIQPLVAAACIPNNPPQTGKVVDVVDGDTIKVMLDQDGKIYSVRYIGMDTPEDTSQSEYLGPQATTRNTELVGGKTVTLIKDVSETDRYGRLLRYVLANNAFVNYELVLQGYANTATYPPDVACVDVFRAAEQTAAVQKIGLWAAPPTLAAVPTLPSRGGGGVAACNCQGPNLDCKDFSSHAKHRPVTITASPWALEIHSILMEATMMDGRVNLCHNGQV